MLLFALYSKQDCLVYPNCNSKGKMLLHVGPNRIRTICQVQKYIMAHVYEALKSEGGAFVPSIQLLLRILWPF